MMSSCSVHRRRSLATPCRRWTHAPGSSNLCRTTSRGKCRGQWLSAQRDRHGRRLGAAVLALNRERSLHGSSRSVELGTRATQVSGIAGCAFASASTWVT